jgi:ABC-type molybdenum transport system ATPase subunit/photorepair protein PhrA
MPTEAISLSPSQQEVMASLERSLAFGRISVIWGDSGFGKTTMLSRLHQTRFAGAPLLSTVDFLTVMRGQDPLAMEEAYAGMLLEALDRHETLLVDDLHLLNARERDGPGRRLPQDC